VYQREQGVELAVLQKRWEEENSALSTEICHRGYIFKADRNVPLHHKPMLQTKVDRALPDQFSFYNTAR
jgi:hypothetical protein